MHGDFSTRRFDPAEGHQGVLYQQGRLLSDADLTDGEAIALAWRRTAARDVIGADVLAVPAAEPDGYQVVSAVVDGDDVLVGLRAGRAWADGVHTILAGDPVAPGAPVVRRADYLPPPHNPAGTGTDQIADGVRDAVVLEVRLEALNAFQDPVRLIEPALGGPDTAERVVTRTAVRLLRLAAGETCTTIGARLDDDLSDHGRLTVSLLPPTVVGGDCPVVEGGGYEGLEHNLYRVEIARTTAGAPMFVWSGVNGGLVGRGQFHGGADAHVDIVANRAAILSSGLTEFYLEAVELDVDRGYRRVTYGTIATLNAEGELDLTAPATFGTLPGAGQQVFFRLWNGIAPVGDFAGATNPVMLRDGIRLQFDAPAGATYRPGSWWTFEVRAGEIGNPEVLVDDAAPFGPEISRVPLAEITWTGAGDTGQGGEIEDCRNRFRPLTNQKVCCTHLVGNGVTTFGDFNSLEEAAEHLPPGGGQLCLLPGVHAANLELVGRFGIRITGCRHRTFLVPRATGPDRPVIRVAGGQDISVEGVDVIAPLGTGIELAAGAASLREVTVEDCRILALTHAIRVDTASDVRILRNQVWLLDQPAGVSTISLHATGALLEGNRAGVWPFEAAPPLEDAGGGNGDQPDPADPCFDEDDLAANVGHLIIYAQMVWAGVGAAAAPTQPYEALGGIHVRAGSERVELRRNRVAGGIGHGIMLGGAVPGDPAPAGGRRDGEPVRGPVVQVTDGGFLAQVRFVDGTPAVEHTLTLHDREDGDALYHGLTDEAGEVEIDAGRGVYMLGVEPGYEVLEIRRTTVEQRPVHVVVIGRTSDEPDETADGFLTTIRILDNEIEQMGLSGIGFGLRAPVRVAGPRPDGSTDGSTDDLAETLSATLAPTELLSTTDLVRDLVVRDNRIVDNLRIVFTDEMRRLAGVVAHGGISLAAVEGLTIERNEITGNGTDAANPSAGIFLGYGEDVVIAGNRITENGPVGASYRELRSEGLRGGIVVRLASSVLAGATDDGLRKPALVVRDNVVDQTAGRAITALAYGPVSCVGNTLNAEHEGAWGVFDELVGAVLIVNLGGIHRFQDSRSPSEARDFTNLAGPGRPRFTTSGRAYKDAVELMLPGGETLFSSNQVRTGPENRAWTSQLILTADDLGYDGNQSGMFRPDLTFTNLLGIAHSVRVTGSRFRERATAVAMSALTLAGGTTASASARAMNTTTQNQGDHCIIAISGGTVPLVEHPNQVVSTQFCPEGDGGPTKAQYVLATFLVVWRQVVAPDFQVGQDAAVVNVATTTTVNRLARFQAQTHLAYATEARRVAARYGADDPRSLDLAHAARVRKRKAAVLRVQADIARVREAPAPREGVLFEGRVADRTGRAVRGAVIELVGPRGRPLGVSATADATGYFAVEIDEQRRDALARGEVLLRVTDPDGTVLEAPKESVVLGTGRRARHDVVVERRRMVVDLRDVRPVFTHVPTTSSRADTPTGTDVPTRPVRPPPPEVPAQAGRPPRKDVPTEPAEPTGPDATGPRAPTGSVQPDSGTRPSGPRGPEGPRPRRRESVDVMIESVRGIGPVNAERLRSAGVETARALLALPQDRLADLVGGAASRLRAAAQEAIEEVAPE
ncbi:DUF6519 domain-containing protein [Kineococcus indalonis]|uniref:DUF6519 domain-containing protein n=1 Tax=Kineococcus indalonis TaxID=2696566 RepID=UPI001413193E|nr:DUF6519 domain-containing protein [Kineococcus indalonis]NAZ84905.1 hypothetical protein [Kineococcus indalonis]